MGISGCNMPNLPPEAFELAQRLEMDTMPDQFAARSKHARGVGLGPYVERLMNFNEEQQRGTPQHSLEGFWKPLISAYFSPEATIHLDIKSINCNKPRSIKIPVEALPRIWKSKYDAGVNEERMLMEHPCEFILPSGAVVVDCPKAVILTRYQNSTVQTNGHLRVSFRRDQKIVSWEFSSQFHEELYPRTAFTPGSSPPPASCSEFGIPASVIRLMLIAENINELGSKIGEGISKLLAEPDQLSIAQPAQAPPPPQSASPFNPIDQKAFELLPSLPNRQNTGNAYRALLSQLGGNQSLQPQQNSFNAPNVNLPSSRANPTTAPHASQDNLGLDMKPGMENDATVVPNLRDAISGWKTGPQSSPADVFPGLFDETLRSPFAPVERDNGRKSAARSQADLNLSRQENHSTQRAQSAIEAVAAAATGQGGWGVVPGMVPSGGRELNADGGGGEIDRGFQLMNASVDATLSLHQKNSGQQRHNMTRQTAPPGLSMFTPRSKEVDGNDGGGGGRQHERGSNGESASLKEFEGSQANGSVAATLPEFAVASQGAETVRKEAMQAEGANSGKDRSMGVGVGSKRAAQRNAAVEESAEKRQKTGPQTGEQK